MSGLKLFYTNFNEYNPLFLNIYIKKPVINSAESRAGEQDSAVVLKDMNSWTMVLETSMPLEKDQEE